jgi:dihydroflavonol-4-reductase
MSEPAAQPPTVFVTGATGFIGSHLVEELQRRGYGEIRCLVRSRLKWLEGVDITPVRGEIEDTPELRAALRDVDYVYHVGGVTRATEWKTFEDSNVRATLTLLDLATQESPSLKRFLVTSSLAAVGKCDVAVATEGVPMRPVSDYGRSKAAMERKLQRRIGEGGGVPITIIRPPAVYGPREADIYTFFQTLARGIAPIVGRGSEPALTLVHAHDLVRGMVDAAESEAAIGRTYFIGSERAYTWNEVIDAAKAALGRKVLTIPVPESLVGTVGAASEVYGRITGTYPPLNREKAREIRYANKICSSRRAHRDFGYRQQVALDEGIRETIEWYQKEGWL